MRNCIVPSLAVLSGIGSVAAVWSGRRGSSSSSRNAVGVGSVVGAKPSFVLAIRGGANEYETKFESAKSSVIEKAMIKVRARFVPDSHLYYIFIDITLISSQCLV